MASTYELVKDFKALEILKIDIKRLFVGVLKSTALLLIKI